MDPTHRQFHSHVRFMVVVPHLQAYMLFTGCPDGCSVCTYSLYVIYRMSRWVLGQYLLTVYYLQGVRMGARSVLTHCMLFTGCLEGTQSVLTHCMFFTECPDGCSVCTYCMLFIGCPDGCSVCTYSLYVIYRVSGGVLSLYLLTMLFTGCPEGCSVSTY